MENIQRFNKMCVVACVASYMLMLVINICAMLVCNVAGISASYPLATLNLSSACLEVFIIVSVIVYRRLVMTQPGILVNFYLADKLLKMIVAVLIVVASLKCKVDSPIVYSAVFFVMFVGTIVTDSIFYSKTEKELSNEMAK